MIIAQQRELVALEALIRRSKMLGELMGKLIIIPILKGIATVTAWLASFLFS